MKAHTVSRGALVLATAVGLILASATWSSAAQLLLSPGFESGVPSFNGDSCGGEAEVGGWIYSSIALPGEDQHCLGFWNGAVTGWGGGTTVRTGSNSVRAFHYGGWDQTPQHLAGWRYASIRQVADVLGGAQYTASVWTWAYNDGNPAEPGGFYYGLRVEELDASDNVLDTHEQLYNTPVAAWREASVQFVTQAQTTRLRYLLVMYWYQNSNHTHIDFDDASLVGPAANAKVVSGTVTGEGSPLNGATVSADGDSVSTSGSGFYSVELPGAVSDVAVRASQDGYFAQRKYRTLTASQTTVDFDLVAVGNNLLSNAGFDDNSDHSPSVVPDNWALQSGGFGKESFFLEAFYTNYIRSGEEAAGLMTDNVPEEVVLTHAPIAVVPGEQYTASAWVYPAGEGFMWYAGSSQKAALLVRQFDQGGKLLDEHYEYLTTFNAWQKLSYTFTAEADAMMVQVSAWANLTEAFSDWLTRAVFDDMALEGPSGGDIPSLFGVVESGENPLPDARVHLTFVPGYETITDAEGTWALDPPDAGYSVRALKEGYYTQRIVRTAPSLESIVFDLVEIGNNLLTNAGFDDDPYTKGWVEEQSGEGNTIRRGEYRFIVQETATTPYWWSGEEALALLNAGSNPGGCWYWQDVGVLSNQQYTAEVMFKPSVADGGTTIFGNTSDDQVAGLLIKEYDASGNLVYEHPLLKADETGDWEALSKVFTTRPTTASVKIGPYAWLLETSPTNWWWPRATFDDVALRGPKAPHGLTGTVTSNGTPLANAVIEVATADDGIDYFSTNAQGEYTATVDYGSTVTITASLGGYYPQVKGTTVAGQRVVDFDLIPVGDNLLLNPGFDASTGYLSGGWQILGNVMHETWTGNYGPIYVHSPGEAAYIRNPANPGRVYQDVAVLPNTNYSASAQFRPGTDPRYGSVWGVNTAQEGALFIQLLDENKQIIGTELRDYAEVSAANLQQWYPLSLNVTTTSDTAFIRVGGWANMVDNYDANLARAIFDTFSLNGPAAPGEPLGTLKGMDDGSSVKLGGKVVSARFPGYFYAQEADRSSGIRVNGYANPGDLVDVQGTMSTVDGERVITVPIVVQKATGNVPEPLGIVQRNLDLGLSPVGLYMTLWGKVTESDSGGGWFSMTDGSGASIKVYGAADVDDYVIVTGAVGAELDGEDAVPVLRSVAIEPVQ